MAYKQICVFYSCLYSLQVCSHMVTNMLLCMAIGKPVRDPQQYVGQEWSADQGTGYDLCAITLLQLHD